jgi:hypothetical protein
MPNIQVTERIAIPEIVEDLFPYFSKLKNWEQWSPWLVSDPGATFIISKDEKSANWKGRSIGEGEVKILSIKENESIEIEIHCLTPTSFDAKVTVSFERMDMGTFIDCLYEEKIPFLKSLWNKNRPLEIAFDIKRGMRMVECLVIDGTLNSDLKMIGVQRRFGYDYLGIKHKVSIDLMQPLVLKDFERLIPYSSANIPDRDRPWPFIIYHEWNRETYEVSFTSCVSIIKEPDELPTGMVLGRTEDTRLFAINHKGGHKHITNAWRALHYMEQADLIDVNKEMGYIAMEYFRRGPLEVPEKEINSDLIFPLNEVNIMSNKVYVSR